jgi:hypothetical protein
MKQLFLADLENLMDAQVREGLIDEWKAVPTFLNNFQILIAYQSVGDYGCDSSAFYLLRHKRSKELFIVHGSHCSCYGFEEQFTPELTNLKYLQSDMFSLDTGGYDEQRKSNQEKVKEFLAKMKK